MSRMRGSRGAAGLRTALLALLTLLAGWSGTATASAASTLRLGPAVSAGHAGPAQAGVGRPSGVRPSSARTGDRAGTSQAVTTTSGTAVAQPDRRIPGPLPALPTSTVVLVRPLGAAARAPAGPPQVPGPLFPAAVRGRAPPLLVSPAPDQ